jgi:hypothetical protein
LLIILESVVNDHLIDSLASVAREEANFGKLAAEGGELAFEDAAAFADGHLGKRESEVAHADGAEASVKVVDGVGNGDAYGAGQRPREQADGFDCEPSRREFQTLTHRDAETVSLRKQNCPANESRIRDTDAAGHNRCQLFLLRFLCPLGEHAQERVSIVRDGRSTGQRTLETHHVTIEVASAVLVLGDGGAIQFQSGKGSTSA